LRSLARATWKVGLPAVVAHQRHRGGNSTPLDIPVGDTITDRSGPVTEVAGRIGVAVHEILTPRTHPRPVAELEVGLVATAAMMGLGGGEPAAGDLKLAAGPLALVGQGGTDPAKAGLGDGAPKRPPAYPRPIAATSRSSTTIKP
jgi:hypothetical protein